MLWVGLGGLVVAVVCGFVARHANGRINALETVETLPVGDLRALHQAAAEAAGTGNFRQRCEVVGAARAHKNGVLHSELEKLECVWSKHKITRKYEETYRDSNGNRRRRTKNQVVSEHSSSMAFFVQDETGKMAVRPGDKDVDGAEKVLDTFEQRRGGRGQQVSLGPVSFNLGSGDGTLGFKKEEWVVRPGTRLFVHGEASDADGLLAVGAPAEGGVFLMSTRDQAQIVRSEQHKVLGFGIGAGATGVAGAVLIVLVVLGVLS